ncbi:DUF4302 domain-containing protein [Pedobacter caeni]|uniref:DUF4302 domain-containing protein n=1 Tax=Pedobacter caeni TaxID=288992 RepID=A0A1M5HIZ1_9SPHI|nr:DUF4302 domain-containing protein [Pedobacter caeni]SHG15943.1 protein of unknown function [Pedobacter caeni]
MKKNIIYILIAVFFMASCKKGELARFPVEKSFTDETIKLSDLQKLVASGTEGFKINVESTTGNSYSGYLRFNGANDAKFVLDNNLVAASTPVETKYAFRSKQTNAVLTFGKKGAFTALATALKLDSTYSYRSANKDTIVFLGDELGTKLSLIKAVKKDADEYLAGNMGKSMNAIKNLGAFKRYFKRLTIGANAYDLMFNGETKFLTINYLKNNSFQTFSSYYTYTNAGIDLATPFVDGATVMTSFSDLQVDLAANSGKLMTAGVAGIITNEIAPVAKDGTAAKAFFNSPPNGARWYSYEGFTVEGVPDAYGVKNIPGFIMLIFYPKVNPAYSRLGFWVNNAYGKYGPGPINEFPADGTIKFVDDGDFGTAPPAILPIVRNTTNKWQDTKGFYVIKTGKNTCDLVSVTDAKAWISWGPEK